MLVMDREPIRWEGEGRGLAWSERPETISGAGIRDWRDAACAAAACGLVLDGRRSYVHSSVAGMAPVYYMEHDGAVYFATTIDALALASPRRLSVDWEAWAGILTVDFPLGDRTPFAEIRLLRPFSTLEVRWRRARVETSRWPWAEVESNLDVAEGTAAVLDGMRASIARLPPGPIVCHLSGGLDSRLCLGLLSEQRRSDISTLTVDPDKGTDRELRIAAQIAAASGFSHQTVVGSSADYWRGSRGAVATRRLSGPSPALADADARGLCATPARPRSTGSASTTWPGPTLGSSPPKPSAPKATTRQSRASGTQFARDRPAGHLGCSTHGLGAALWASSHRQYMAESERFRGHPARSVLTYWTRQARYVSMTPYATLGAEVPMSMPLIDDAVARACFAITFESKRGGRLYDALFAVIDPRLLSLPIFNRDEGAGAKIPRRNRSAAIADAVYATVTDGPLTPWVKTRALRRLTRHHRGREPRTDRAAIGIVTFHQWCERYRHVLGEIDVAEGFEVPRPDSAPG